MSDERIGSEIAGYRIVSVLGQGGMGTVYIAEQTSPRRKVALKLLRHDLSSDDAFRTRFEHESEAAASTEHPNIVPIYASGEADGTLFIAMRYVEGIDLRDMIATEGPVAADRAIEVVSQVAGALDAAHARGLVHRDVKPGNILLDARGNAYLSDFGLIKRNSAKTGLTKTGQFMGSVEYCAPEQIRGDEVDGRADVYSLGCVLYECLSGRSPFKRETEIATLYAQLEQEPPRLSPGSLAPTQELDRVIGKAMAKKPADRYASAAEFARDARHALGVASGERDAVPRRKRRRLAVIVGAGVLVAAMAVAGVILARPEPGGSGSPTAPIGTGSLGSVAQLDPETGEIVQAVPGISYARAEFQTGGLAAGEGGVWVGSPANIQHVDPVTGTLRRTIVIQSFANVVPVVGFRTVWVDTGLVVERINPATDDLLRPVPYGNGEQAFVTWIALGEGAVWTASQNWVYQIDPVENRVVREIPVTGSTGIGVGAGAIWVIDDLSSELTRIDPRTGEVTGAAHVAGSLDEVAAGGGSVWVLDKDAGTVSVVDPARLEVQDTIRVGSDETDMAFGGGAVWLADGAARSVTRLDPLTHEPTVFEVDGWVANVAVDPDSDAVWVLLAAERQE